MKSASGRIEFDPEFIDRILDEIGEKAEREFRKFNGVYDAPTESEVAWATKVLKSAGLIKDSAA
ncbi:hypothetical protein FE840_011900 [Peteryoungia desertarenae]|uniref:Uncharacterized protein n=1 Tax=Peteryoungia desertarenae TaxID=1813451 RepID=A0ABX6QPK9_9HYPH|nr:hypothetical protein [Peteryoungia desertarenae]QLF70185.1 hypothetical protein FE840_011900 [Peteryoungia desertarenae]